MARLALISTLRSLAPDDRTYAADLDDLIRFVEFERLTDSVCSGLTKRLGPLKGILPNDKKATIMQQRLRCSPKEFCSPFNFYPKVSRNILCTVKKSDLQEALKDGTFRLVPKCPNLINYSLKIGEMSYLLSNNEEKKENLSVGYGYKDSKLEFETFTADLAGREAVNDAFYYMSHYNAACTTAETSRLSVAHSDGPLPLIERILEGEIPICRRSYCLVGHFTAIEAMKANLLV